MSTLKIQLQKPTPEFDLEYQESRLHRQLQQKFSASLEKKKQLTELRKEGVGQMRASLRSQLGIPTEPPAVAPYEAEEVKTGEVEPPEFKDSEKRRTEITKEIEALNAKRPSDGSFPPVIGPCGSCVSVSPPMSSEYVEVNTNTELAAVRYQPYLNPQQGEFGGHTWLWRDEFLHLGGGGESVYLVTGIGEWLFSGPNSGVGTVRADYRVSGKCLTSAWYQDYPGSVLNQAFIYLEVLDPGNVWHISRFRLYDEGLVPELYFPSTDSKEFDWDAFSLTVEVPIAPDDWYFVFAYLDLWSVGYYDAYSHADLRIVVPRFEICV